MKFKKLTREFNDLLDKKDKGRKPESKQVVKMLSLLEEKKASYESRMNTDMSEKDRHKLDVKLKVVDIQIDKLKAMLGDDL